MKDLLLNFWNGKASTIAGGLVALGVWFGSEAANAPEWLQFGGTALAVLLGGIFPPASKDEDSK